MSSNTVKLHRVLRATPDRVYRAFLDADAMAKCTGANGTMTRHAAAIRAIATEIGLAPATDRIVLRTRMLILRRRSAEAYTPAATRVRRKVQVFRIAGFLRSEPAARLRQSLTSGTTTKPSRSRLRAR